MLAHRAGSGARTSVHSDGSAVAPGDWQRDPLRANALGLPCPWRALAVSADPASRFPYREVGDGKPSATT
jgi:hypothetical protein